MGVRRPHYGREASFATEICDFEVFRRVGALLTPRNRSSAIELPGVEHVATTAAAIFEREMASASASGAKISRGAAAAATA